MKKLLLLLIVIVLTSCVNEMTDPYQPTDLMKSGKIIEKDLELINIIGGFYAEPDPKACTTTGMIMVVYGKGNGTHLGNFTLSERYCMNEYAEPQIFVNAYFTAANGDQIYYFAIERWLEEETGVSHARYIIDGGTGRFENATGEFVNTVVQNLENWTFTGTAEGTISY